MKRLLLLVACLLLLGVQLGGCGPDKAKMEACGKSDAALKSGDGCAKCCKDAGAQGHSYMNFDKAECKCL